MLLKNIKYIVALIFIFYQTSIYSKSTSLEKFDSNNFSKYFSGIVALENRNNSDALDFFDSSKTLIDKHDPYFKKYISSLILENEILKAINLIKYNKNKEIINFFEAYLLLSIDSIKRNELDNANEYLEIAFSFIDNDTINTAILETLKQYIFVFKENKILDNQKNFGNLSLISKTFQKCFLNDARTDAYFVNLINDNEADFSRYIFFYTSYLIENDRLEDAYEVTKDINSLNSTLLLSQAKSWLKNDNLKRFKQIFSCKNRNDIISEFLFLISNLYSSYENLEKSNIYLNLSYYLNPKFVFNLSLVSENYFLNEDYVKTKKILKEFKKEDIFYYWYRVKTEAQIITKIKNQEESLNYIVKKFNEFEKPNQKMIFDLANYYKNSKKYDLAIKNYTILINDLENDLILKSDLLYRRGGSYERLGNFQKADEDLLESLRLDPDDPYVLNYLAYSWLERNYKIKEAIEMLENAYLSESDDPYIIDSIGWAYYLVDDYSKAEEFLRRAVELMPNDPIVNDHYGDILWKLNRKIQARYFWTNVLKMDKVEDELLKKINIKIIEGLKKS